MNLFRRLKKFIGGTTGSSPSSHKPDKIIGLDPSQVILHEGDVIQLYTDGYPTSRPMTISGQKTAGGFGTVYKVEVDGMVYGLKVLTLWLKLPNEWADLVRRFESSFRAGKIDSINIINYYEKGYYKDNPCILMEWCPNGDLDDRMEEFYEKDKWQKLGINLLKALQALHNHGIIHKDFKPKNILFDEKNVPKLTDFDFSAFLDKRNTILKGGRSLDLWYTAIYSPPEQIDPNIAYEKTGPAVDMFAFAVTMYQIITGGHLPWGSFEEYHQNSQTYYEKIKTGDFKPISFYRQDVPSEWAYCLERCLAPNIEKRIQTPAEFLRNVNYALEPEPQPQPSEPVEIQECIHVVEIKTGANNVGTQFVLEKLEEEGGDIHIGRLANSSIHVDAILPLEGVHHVSRKHSTIRCENNKWLISDGCNGEDRSWKESLNGTEVFNPVSGTNRVIPSKEFIELHENDIINLAGEVTLKFFKVEV